MLPFENWHIRHQEEIKYLYNNATASNIKLKDLISYIEFAKYCYKRSYHGIKYTDYIVNIKT